MSRKPSRMVNQQSSNFSLSWGNDYVAPVTSTRVQSQTSEPDARTEAQRNRYHVNNSDGAAFGMQLPIKDIPLRRSQGTIDLGSMSRHTRGDNSINKAGGKSLIFSEEHGSEDRPRSAKKNDYGAAGPRIRDPVDVPIPKNSLSMSEWDEPAERPKSPKKNVIGVNRKYREAELRNPLHGDREVTSLTEQELDQQKSIQNYKRGPNVALMSPNLGAILGQGEHPHIGPAQSKRNEESFHSNTAISTTPYATMPQRPVPGRR